MRDAQTIGLFFIRGLNKGHGALIALEHYCNIVKKLDIQQYPHNAYGEWHEE